MGRIAFITTLLVFAYRTLGAGYIICDDLLCDDVKPKTETVEQLTRINLLTSAARWLPVRELTGNNDHPQITKSMNLCGLSGTMKYPWCASSHSEIFHHAKITTTISARVVDWFKTNIIWEHTWKTPLPKQYLQPGMSIGFFYTKLNRYGHIGLLAHTSSKYVFLYEGNTSPKGQFDPETFEELNNIGTGVTREGDGFYPKVRPWATVGVIADKCLSGNSFTERYNEYLKATKNK